MLIMPTPLIAHRCGGVAAGSDNQELPDKIMTLCLPYTLHIQNNRQHGNNAGVGGTKEVQ
jgi:hypothetical protein